MKATTLIEACIPRAARAAFAKLPADRQTDVAQRFVADPAAMLKAFGPVSFAEVIVDMAAATKHKAFSEYSRELLALEVAPEAWADPQVRRDELRTRYESKVNEADEIRGRMLTSLAKIADHVLVKDRESLFDIDEARARRLRDDIATAAKLGPDHLDKLVLDASSTGKVDRELRVALYEVRLERAKEADPNGAEADRAIDTLLLAVSPPEVQGAAVFLAQVEALEPAFEAPDGYATA
jgi:hypothetical protein